MQYKIRADEMLNNPVEQDKFVDRKFSDIMYIIIKVDEKRVVMRSRNMQYGQLEI